MPNYFLQFESGHPVEQGILNHPVVRLVMSYNISLSGQKHYQAAKWHGFASYPAEL